MSDTPSYILRNCAIFVNRVSKIGQANEINLPVPTEKMEELRNAGMVMPIDIPLGYEKLEASFKLTAFDPQVITQFGLAVGVEREFMVTGALAHEDGTILNATAYIRGRLTRPDHGGWRPGAMAENTFSISIRYYKLEVAGSVLIEMDPFSVSIGGSSQTAAIRAALLA
ncbi:phage major tail tube protein [Ancylobacter amanitiformis]|uniref:P2 family phage contractile tail tube protein n=1 Tax=Ancylobacter amanitiformis TaxID=217069 RepID=A0ABU0LQD4_9HYPH|nr:phage major tail tube protein [Ancylobacter amanitiformis]MDQ0510873.1 P2 family phage contractile tail tube protein [Ancylobacter amanitiformis]